MLHKTHSWSLCKLARLNPGLSWKSGNKDHLTTKPQRLELDIPSSFQIFVRSRFPPFNRNRWISTSFTFNNRIRKEDLDLRVFLFQNLLCAWVCCVWVHGCVVCECVVCECVVGEWMYVCECVVYEWMCVSTYMWVFVRECECALCVSLRAWKSVLESFKEPWN